MSSPAPSSPLASSALRLSRLHQQSVRSRHKLDAGLDAERSSRLSSFHVPVDANSIDASLSFKSRPAIQELQLHHSHDSASISSQGPISTYRRRMPSASPPLNASPVLDEAAIALRSPLKSPKAVSVASEIERHVTKNYQTALKSGGELHRVLDLDFHEITRDPTTTAKYLSEGYKIPGVGYMMHAKKAKNASDTSDRFSKLAVSTTEEERRKKEMRLVLCVEQAAAMLKRFKMLVPFIQKLEQTLSAKLPSEAKGFYLWKGITRNFGRAKTVSYMWRIRSGLEKCSHLVSSSQRQAIVRRFYTWHHNASEMHNHQASLIWIKCKLLSDMISIFKRNHREIRRAAMRYWHQQARFLAMQKSISEQDVQLRERENSLDESFREQQKHERNLIAKARKNTLKRLLRRLCHSYMHQSLDRWHKKTIVNSWALYHLFHALRQSCSRRQRRCFRAWTSRVQFLRLREQNLGWVCHQARRRRLLAGFNLWKNETKSILRREQTTFWMKSKLNYRKISISWRTWILFVSKRKRFYRGLRTVKRLVALRIYMNMMAAFHVWQTGSRVMSQIEEMSSHLIRQWSTLQLAKVFRAWHEISQSLSNVRQKAAHADNLRNILLLRRVWKRWSSDWTQPRLMLRRLFLVRVHRWQMNSLFWSFSSKWKIFTISARNLEAAKARAEIRRLGLMRRVATLERKRHSLITTRYLRRVMNKALVKAFDSWIDGISQRKRLRTMIQLAVRRWSSARLQYGFHVWSGRFLQGSRQSEKEELAKRRQAYVMLRRVKSSQLSRSFNQWISYVIEKRRTRRFLLQMKNRTAAKCFKKWCYALENARKCQASAKKLVTRLRNRKVAMFFLTWHRYASVRIALRSRLRISISRWEIANAACAFKRWREFVQRDYIATMKLKDYEQVLKFRLKHMLITVRRVITRSGFRRWAHVFCLGQIRAEQIKLHSKTLELVEGRVKKDMKRIRQRVKSLRYKALANLLNRTLQLVHQMKTHCAFLRWKNKSDAFAQSERNDLTLKVLSLERAAFRRKQKRRKALSRGFWRWYTKSVKSEIWRQRQGRCVIALNRFIKLKSIQHEQVHLGSQSARCKKHSAIRDLVLRGAFRRWEQNWDIGLNMEQRRQILEKGKRERALRHVARTLFMFLRRRLHRRYSQLFHRWIKLVILMREKDCEDRVASMRELVFKQAKDAENGILAIVRKRLINSVRDASVASASTLISGTEKVDLDSEDWRGKILNWTAKRRKQLKRDELEDSKSDLSNESTHGLTSETFYDHGSNHVETEPLEVRMGLSDNQTKFYGHPYYDGYPTPSQETDGSLISLPQYHDKLKLKYMDVDQ